MRGEANYEEAATVLTELDTGRNTHHVEHPEPEDDSTDPAWPPNFLDDLFGDGEGWKC